MRVGAMRKKQNDGALLFSYLWELNGNVLLNIPRVYTPNVALCGKQAKIRQHRTMATISVAL
jgi:hypothetical protein